MSIAHIDLIRGRDVTLHDEMKRSLRTRSVAGRVRNNHTGIFFSNAMRRSWPSFLFRLARDEKISAA